jgi:hypothetical protein
MAGESQTAPASSTLTREPPTIRRLRSVFGVLQKFIVDNDDGGMMARMAPLMTTFMDELAEELGEKDELYMGMYLAQMGHVIAWIGHGDNDKLPPELRVFAEAIQPSAFSDDTPGDVRVAERDSSRESTSERDTWNSRALAPSPQA